MEPKVEMEDFGNGMHKYDDDLQLSFDDLPLSLKTPDYNDDLFPFDSDLSPLPSSSSNIKHMPNTRKIVIYPNYSKDTINIIGEFREIDNSSSTDMTSSAEDSSSNYKYPPGRRPGIPTKYPANHKCPICQRAFTQKFSLNRHKMLVHEREKKPTPSENANKTFMCTICNRGFDQKFSLNRHHAIVHEKRKNSVCTICNKRFLGQYELTLHINQVHEKIKNFYCKYCSRAFGRKDSLRRHEKVHDDKTGKTIEMLSTDPQCKLEKESFPYYCELCQTFFQEEGLFHQHRLQVHGLKSDSDRLLNVQYLNSNSVHSDAVQIQQRLQQLEKTYLCCGKSFKYQTSLLLHQKTHKS